MDGKLIASDVHRENSMKRLQANYSKLALKRNSENTSIMNSLASVMDRKQSNFMDS